LDGYDEVSLTGSFKLINNRAEQIKTLKELGFDSINPAEIRGGDTVEEAAAIFRTILNNEGTDVQNKVVLANAAIAINTIKGDASFKECYAEAEESLFSGKALKSFKTLLRI